MLGATAGGDAAHGPASPGRRGGFGPGERGEPVGSSRSFRSSGRSAARHGGPKPRLATRDRLDRRFGSGPGGARRFYSVTTVGPSARRSGTDRPAPRDQDVAEELAVGVGTGVGVGVGVGSGAVPTVICGPSTCWTTVPSYQATPELDVPKSIPTRFPDMAQAPSPTGGEGE